MRIALTLVFKVMVVLSLYGSSVHAEDAGSEPVGTPQTYDCKLSDGHECDYTYGVAKSATKDFIGKCRGGEVENMTMTCTGAAHVSCSKVTNTGLEFKCNCQNYGTAHRNNAYIKTTCNN